MKRRISRVALLAGTVVLCSALRPSSTILRAQAVAATATAAPRVAVLDFSNGTPIDPATVEPLRRALGSTLAGALARSGRMVVIERNRLHDLLVEQDLGKSGRVEEASAARIGKLLGVDYLFAGAFIVQPNREILVSTRLVNIATGAVTAGPEVVGDVRSATKLIGQLAGALARQLKIPSDTSSGPKSTVRDSPELSASLDALAQACDARDSARVAKERAAVEKRAPGHPALAAPCFK